MALKKKENNSLPSPPPNSDVHINDEMVCDEVRVKIDVYTKKLIGMLDMSYSATCLIKKEKLYE